MEKNMYLFFKFQWKMYFIGGGNYALFQESSFFTNRKTLVWKNISFLFV